jgi:predicted nucleotidyltransferase component of viral defense system
MDKTYADTVRLLLAVAPDVFRRRAFAMKGGTAINLFVREMPRLSVDIDVVFTDWNMPRTEALTAITIELASIRDRLTRIGLSVDTIGSASTGDRSIVVSSGDSVVKVEVNTVFRGTVLPTQKRSLVAGAAEKFAAELELPVLAVDELYGSKLVAAMDRQHPRDFFDVLEMYKANSLSDQAIECFVTYLAGHNRPMHEVLFGRSKDISLEYRSTFVGMTSEHVPLEVLLETRDRLFRELPRRLSDRQRAFLIGLAGAEPDWSLLNCSHAAALPAVQWKLLNLQNLQKTNPAKLDEQAKALEKGLK